MSSRIDPKLGELHLVAALPTELFSSAYDLESAHGRVRLSAVLRSSLNMYARSLESVVRSKEELLISGALPGEAQLMYLIHPTIEIQ